MAININDNYRMMMMMIMMMKIKMVISRPTLKVQPPNFAW